MPEDPSRVSCPVEFQPGAQRGEYANAFRVVADIGHDVFLDFLVYMPAERKAYVVSRVRVHKTFLPNIRSRCGQAMAELSKVEDQHLPELPKGSVTPLPAEQSSSILVHNPANGEVYFVAPLDKGESN